MSWAGPVAIFKQKPPLGFRIGKQILAVVDHVDVLEEYARVARVGRAGATRARRTTRAGRARRLDGGLPDWREDGRSVQAEAT